MTTLETPARAFEAVPAGTAEYALEIPMKATLEVEAALETSGYGMYAAVDLGAMSAAPAAQLAFGAMSAEVDQDILNDPSRWPAAFARPVVATRILTYVFEEKDSSKVEEFVKFINENFAGARLSVIKDKAGFTTTTITEVVLASAAQAAQVGSKEALDQGLMVEEAAALQAGRGLESSQFLNADPVAVAALQAGGSKSPPNDER